MARFDSVGELVRRIGDDLQAFVGAPVSLHSDPVLPPPPPARDLHSLAEPGDPPDWDGDLPTPAQLAQAMQDAAEGKAAAETSRRWYWDGFRCLCPVTGQPDWASVTLAAPQPVPGAPLLRLLAAHRQRPSFHEAACEGLFAALADLWPQGPLAVAMRFAPRGGIAIQPVRHRGLPQLDQPTIGP